ncbi:hypothetical protein SH2C18_20030 [Clostridium sediminicola]|uniref:hypothetical protein n=1 Tax=Clostridium sediminicola TaxID=3114879 RepID=UPI0031F21E3A
MNRKKAFDIYRKNSEITDIRISFIKSFLKSVKKEIVKGKFTLAERTKNMDFIKDKGLMIPEDIKEVIFNLSYRDCVGGPEADRDGYEGDIYIFKTDVIDEVITYIKIRYNPPDEVICISFHEDDY